MSYLFRQRPTAARKRYLVVLSATRSRDDVSYPAYYLKRQGVTIIGIGEGARSNTNQLKQISTSPKNAFKTSFNRLTYLIRTVKKLICKNAPSGKKNLYFFLVLKWLLVKTFLKEFRHSFG